MDGRWTGRVAVTAFAAGFVVVGLLGGREHVLAGAPHPSAYVGPGPRPGPDVLYAPVATAPQLTNTGIWSAPSILVSGASAYRRGEFLYQDFLYDDHGAAAPVPDPGDARSSTDGFSKPDGTYTYPTGQGYNANAADLVEFRVKPLDDSTAFRVTLNTLLDPKLVAIAVAIGDSPVAQQFPDGANVKAPAQLFLTVHPSAANPETLVGDMVDAATQQPVPGIAPAVRLDMTRRQIEVRVSHTLWNPGTATVRLAAGVGLWDHVTGRWLLPGVAATSSTPGGGGGVAAPAAFFNVAFRNEPLPVVSDLATSALHPAWWRDEQQGVALAAGDISDMYADVDFAKVAAGVDDESGVPTTGPIDRILQSHTETAQGAHFTGPCPLPPAGSNLNCTGELTGRLQPYALYIPQELPPLSGYGFTLLLHAFGDNYNEFEHARFQSQLGERGTGSLVASPEARGGGTDYLGYSAADVFEVWADVAAHYPLDPDWSALTGYSVGGIGTFTLAEQFPDLFGRIQTTVAADKRPQSLASLRNVPVLMWNVATDELANAALYGATAASLDADGYRYELDVFAPGEHTTLAINDQFAPVAAFLDRATIDRNPAHVTYVVDPSQDLPPLGLVADHAYWLSGLHVRPGAAPASYNLGTGPTAPGSVDAFSWGFGVGDPPVMPPQPGAGTLTGGNLAVPLAFVSTTRTWGPAPGMPAGDRLDLTLTNIGRVTIDVARAGVDCDVDLHVTTDGPVSLTLDGCGKTLRFG